MSGLTVALATFVCLTAAALAGLWGNAWLSPRLLQDDTNATVRLTANLFVVITSLVVGLMINSANVTFQTNERNVQALATELILLDRTMRALGPPADQARGQLVAYVRQSLTDRNVTERDPQAEAILESVGTSLRAIRVSNEQEIAVWNDARELYRQTIRQRWIVVDALTATIPPALVIIVVSWLVFIVASFGYRAPRNTVTLVALVGVALLMSANLFLILDMDSPMNGFIKVSNQPFQRALEELQK